MTYNEAFEPCIDLACTSLRCKEERMNATMNEPLAEWERELLYVSAHREGEGDVTFTLESGKTVSFDNVRVDSVSPLGENGSVIGVEFFGTDRVVHVPFVSYWEFTYRF